MAMDSKRKKEIRDRREVINKGVSDGTIKEVEFKSLETEVESLNAEYVAIERREAISEALNNGTILGKPIETQPENRKGGTNLNNDLRSTPEYRAAFFAYMQGKETVEQRAMTTLESGAAVIPTQTFDMIIENIKKQQGILPAIRLLNIPGKLSVPQSQIIDPALWHVEGTEIADTSKDPSNVVLSGFELAKLFSMSVATQGMAIAAFESYLVDSLTYAMGAALDTSILIGLGPNAIAPDNPQPTGILKSIWNASNSLTYSGTGLQYENLVDAMGLLASNFRQNASFIMNSVTLYKQFAGMQDSIGRPILIQNMTTGVPMALLGKSIIVDDYVPDDTILFGNPMYYFMNFTQTMSIVRSYEAGFTKGSIIYRAMAVVDGKPVAPAFIKLSKAA